MGMGDGEKGTWKELDSDHSRAVKPGRVGQGVGCNHVWPLGTQQIRSCRKQRNLSTGRSLERCESWAQLRYQGAHSAHSNPPSDHCYLSF